MKRPSHDITVKRDPLDTTVIQAAFDKANLEDLRNAEDIRKFSMKSGYRATDSIAAGIRFGFIRGKANGNRRAEDAHRRLHEYIGVQDKSAPPAQRIRNAASWIDDAAVLRELAAFLEGRATALEAGNAKVKELEPAPDLDFSEEDLNVPDV